jgi:hypothetical protein
MTRNPEQNDAPEFRFNLGDAYPHDRFPMKRLSEYLEQITLMFGEDEHVYFIRLEEGSTVLVARTEPDYVPQLEDNLEAIVRGDAPAQRIAAFDAVRRMFREDDSEGYILTPESAKIIEFPRSENLSDLEPVFGPFSQYEKFTGVPTWVGGEKALKRVALKERNGTNRRFDADENLAGRIAKHLWKATIRVEGTAKWLRDAHGKWILREFKASDFDVLPDTALDEDVAALRAIPGKWKDGDPIHEMDIIRHEDDVQ